MSCSTSSKTKYIWLLLYFVGSAGAFLLKVLGFHNIHPRRNDAIRPMNELSATMNDHVLDCTSPSKDMAGIENIYVISDLHTDNSANLEWLIQRCRNHEAENTPGENDCLIIAGDISHEFSKLEETLSIIIQELGCHVFFIWGNHEAWIGGKEMDSLGISTSLQKIQEVKELCERLGVHTNLQLVGSNNENPVFLLPIESWYDATLSLEGCEDLCSSFDSWPWVDFLRCEWPTENEIRKMCKSDDQSQFIHNDYIVPNTGRIPLGLSKWFALQNVNAISNVQKIYNNFVVDGIRGSPESTKESVSNKVPGIISFSHFLPNQQTLPDWKDPHSSIFKRGEWLDHPVPEVSAKFAKVAGSVLIDDQIRSIVPKALQKSKVKHLHVFGHSHRPKDFVYDGIRYVHNPLGKPKEREMKMVSDNVDFQHIWNCTMSTKCKTEMIEGKMSFSGGRGEIPGVRIIRFWEETKGGKEFLAAQMKQRRRKGRKSV
jgi:Calcineurin-like phosphoesterase.